MARFRVSALFLVCSAIFSVAAFAQYPTPQQAGLKLMNNPGGGQIFYGSLAKDSTLQGAMLTMLRSVHGYFGEKPQVSQFFQAKNTSDSVAAFITVEAHAKSGGAKKLSGLVIVSLQPGSSPTGAAMFDDAAHFAKTQPAMLKAANEALRKEGIANAPPSSAGPGNASTPSGAVEPLNMATGGDRSAAVGLPEGWRVTGVRGGQLTAEGPNHEMAGFGLLLTVSDPRGPRSPYAAQAASGSCGGDIFSTYTSVVNQQRQRNRMSPGDWKLINSKNLGAGTISASFEVDLHDGAGMRRGSAQVTEMCTPGKPTWGMGIANITAPVAVWDRESATFTAMYKSYSQDENVIRGETQKKIDDIHAIGARAKQQAADADATRRASSAAFNQHMDNIDRQSKSFSNYLLDQQQLQAIGNDGTVYHGTVDNGTANALIKADPDRFQSVPTTSFVKGADF